jgi:hemerythrin-like domain-containing protein
MPPPAQCKSRAKTCWTDSCNEALPAINPPALHEGIEMNALDLLKHDHDRIKPLLSELKETTDRAEKTRSELFSRIKEELTVHEIIEEEIFYPTLKKHPKAKEIVLEGYEEHDVVSRLMGELDGMDPTDEAFGPKAKVMAENIEHHIEEEEGEMFKQARDIFGADELDALGERMASRKESARQELFGAVR